MLRIPTYALYQNAERAASLPTYDRSAASKTDASSRRNSKLPMPKRNALKAHTAKNINDTGQRSHNTSPACLQPQTATMSTAASVEFADRVLCVLTWHIVLLVVVGERHSGAGELRLVTGLAARAADRLIDVVTLVRVLSEKVHLLVQHQIPVEESIVPSWLFRRLDINQAKRANQSVTDL